MVRLTHSRAINRPKLIFGVEKAVFMAAFVLAVSLLFVLHTRYGFWMSAVAALAISSVLCTGAAVLTRKDNQFFGVRVRSVFHAALYDPAKFRAFRAVIER